MKIERRFKIIYFKINGKETNTILQLTRELLDNSKVEFSTIFDTVPKCLQLLDLNKKLNHKVLLDGSSFVLIQKKLVDDKTTISDIDTFESKYNKYLEERKKNKRIVYEIEKQKSEENKRKEFRTMFLIALISGLFLLTSYWFARNYA